ncbi:Lipoteichoic acid synthase 1 [Anaerohalosphaera lusitana]|uniref:Lipoteichoic acid synthase 1 n=1 Tax=Anaerohalosphaera lusitana TaxID=1936003 RepID=A0A1U9NNZ3_9BACT|nr:alkaline phosphatase family protein [Anaerohalosphaera lusitana]AQT69619.1 Lipoteichoic acid synthase 1 [Anaerohalosphaera lusitana]
MAKPTNKLNKGTARLSKFVQEYVSCRIETVILLISLVCTVAGKAIVLYKQDQLGGMAQIGIVAISDLLFFGTILLIISMLYALRPSRTMARGAIAISLAVCAWSLLNTGWLIRSGVQLHSGLIRVLARDFKDLWPLVVTHLRAGWGRFILLGILGAICAIILTKFFVKPSKVVKERLYHLKFAARTALIVALIVIIQQEVKSQPRSPAICEILGFSSHWQAIVSSVNPGDEEKSDSGRELYSLDEVRVSAEGEQRPNIVVILLESVSYEATSLGDGAAGTTPNLAELAEAGVNMDCTRVPVSHTTKALWATLAGTDPVIRADYVEALPVEHSYASLPSILGAVGYRSAFFVAAKGTFECAPSLCSNFGFDWGWYRENLEDPSVNLGYLSGDDMRLTGPAFEWIDKSEEPFLLTVLTSVAHDPYELPGEEANAEENAYSRYLKTVRYTDDFIGRMRDELDKRGLAEDTIFCVIGDHGTSFRDELDNGRWIPHEEVIRVPWVINWPGGLEGGRKVETPCSQLDVTPTLLELAGVKVQGIEFDGFNALGGQLDPERRFFFSSWYDQSPLGYVEGDMKYIYWPYLRKVFAYDLSEDPDELEPTVMESDEVGDVVAAITEWERNSWVDHELPEYVEKTVYEHWQVIGSGDAAWAYYISDPRQLKLALKRQERLRD